MAGAYARVVREALDVGSMPAVYSISMTLVLGA